MDKIDTIHTMNGEWARISDADVSGIGVFKFVTIYKDGYENVECIENEDEFDSSAENILLGLQNKKDVKEIRCYQQVMFFN